MRWKGQHCLKFLYVPCRWILWEWPPQSSQEVQGQHSPDKNQLIEPTSHTEERSEPRQIRRTEQVRWSRPQTYLFHTPSLPHMLGQFDMLQKAPASTSLSSVGWLVGWWEVGLWVIQSVWHNFLKGREVSYLKSLDLAVVLIPSAFRLGYIRYIPRHKRFKENTSLVNCNSPNLRGSWTCFYLLLLYDYISHNELVLLEVECPLLP